MILVIAYFIWKESFSLDRILLYTNYLPFEGRSPVIFPDWFIQVLLQSLVILGLLFSIKKVRDVISKNIWFTSFIILIIFITLRITFPYIYDTNYLYQRVPPIYLASLWLGWVIIFSKSKQQKFLTLLAALVLSFVHLTITASATFYIYLFHGIFMHIPAYVLNLNSPLINTIFGVLGGIFVWFLFDKIEIQRFLLFIPNYLKEKQM